MRPYAQKRNISIANRYPPSSCDNQYVVKWGACGNRRVCKNLRTDVELKVMVVVVAVVHPLPIHPNKYRSINPVYDHASSHPVCPMGKSWYGTAKDGSATPMWRRHASASYHSCCAQPRSSIFAHSYPTHTHTHSHSHTHHPTRPNIRTHPHTHTSPPHAQRHHQPGPRETWRRPR